MKYTLSCSECTWTMQYGRIGGNASDTDAYWTLLGHLEDHGEGAKGFVKDNSSGVITEVEY